MNTEASRQIFFNPDGSCSCSPLLLLSTCTPASTRPQATLQRKRKFPSDLLKPPAAIVAPASNHSDEGTSSSHLCPPKAAFYQRHTHLATYSGPSRPSAASAALKFASQTWLSSSCFNPLRRKSSSPLCLSAFQGPQCIYFKPI